MALRPQDYYNTIDVEDYYDKIHRTTWARRVAGMLTGGTLGMGFGAAIGFIGSFLPGMFGALGLAGAAAAGLPALAFIGSTVALSAIIGAFIGITLNCDVASNSASVAAGLEELEKRHKVEELQNGIAVKGTAPAKAGDLPMSATIAPHTKLYNPTTALITGSLFAVFGALLAVTPLAAGFATSSMLGMTGAAGMTASAGMFGMFGSLIGFKNSIVTNKVNNFYFKLITQQYAHPPAEKTLAAVPALTIAPQQATPEPAIATTREKSFAAAMERKTLADILAAQANPEAKTAEIAR